MCAGCCTFEHHLAIHSNIPRQECGIHIDRTVTSASTLSSQTPQTPAKSLYSNSISSLWSETAQAIQAHAETKRAAAIMAHATTKRVIQFVDVIIWHTVSIWLGHSYLSSSEPTSSNSHHSFLKCTRSPSQDVDLPEPETLIDAKRPCTMSIKCESDQGIIQENHWVA